MIFRNHSGAERCVGSIGEVLDELVPPIGNSLCSLNGAMGVMGRSVYGVNFKRAVTGVSDIVPGSRRDKNSRSGANRLGIIQSILCAAHHSDPLPLLKAYKLISIRMYLQANFSPHRNTHQSKL